MKKHTLLLAIAATCAIAVGTVKSDNTIPGITTSVVLKVAKKDGSHVALFVGYVKNDNVPESVKGNKNARGFDTPKALLQAANAFLVDNLTQNSDIGLLTENVTAVNTMLRDMRAFDIDESMITRLVVDNVPEITAIYTNNTIGQFARDNGIDDTGIKLDPVRRVAFIQKVHQVLKQQLATGQVSQRQPTAVRAG